jgi:hypothetical protein
LIIIKSLLLSNLAKQRTLGLIALKAALESWQFSSSYDFEFGAHSRDHGYRPRSKEELKHWFELTLKLIETLVSSDGASTSLVLAALAEKFRGLWTKAGMYDELERVCRSILKKQFWPDGWIAVRETQYFHSKGFTPEISAKLAALEKLLRPADLVEKVRSIVLSSKLSSLDLDFEDDGADDIQTRLERIEANAQSLGKAVAMGVNVFGELLPELVSSEGRLWSFGRGLVEGAEDPSAMWNQLVAQLEVTAEDRRKIQILCGFLHALHARDPVLANFFLDEALQHPTVSPFYPILQTAVGIDKKGLERLVQSVGLGKAPIWVYRNLAFGRATDPISGEDFKKLVLEIAAKTDGFDVASDIVYMRLHSDKDDEQPGILDAGRELMRQVKFTKKNNSEDYHLGKIIELCLVGKEGAITVQDLCAKLKDAASKYETYIFNHADLVNGLFSAQPTVTLDGLLSGNAQEVQVGARILDDVRRRSKSPLDLVPESELLGWCDREPQTRYPIIAAAVTISTHSEETGRGQLTNIALRLLEKAPDRVKVLEQFVTQFRPTSWSGSLAVILESNVKLLDELDGYPDSAVVEFVKQEKNRLGKAIEAERRAESVADRERNARFE